MAAGPAGENFLKRIKGVHWRKKVEEVLKIYGEAWATQNPNLILSIFTEDATYQEGPFATPMVGWNEIGAYWQKKVVEEQANISFQVTKIMIDGNEVMAAWIANFDDLVTNERVVLCGMAFITFEGDYIKSFHEIWQSQRTPLV